MIIIKKILLVPIVLILALITVIAIVIIPIIYVNTIPDCNYSNAILNENIINSIAYNAEAVKEFKRTENLKTEFWIREYIDSTHFLAQFNNDDFCGNVIVEIRESKKGLEHFLKVKGRSYSGYMDDFKYSLDNSQKTQPWYLLVSIV